MLHRIASTAAGCALAFSVAGATTAQAASHTFVDGPGDLWRIGISSATRAPDRSQGDILRTVFAHRQHQVVIRHRFAQLSREGRAILIFAQMRTNTGLVRGVSLFAGPRRANNRWRGEATLERRGGANVACAVTHDINYATNIAVVRVPRTCLDNPRTIQARMVVSTIAGRRSFTDNPTNHGPTRNLPPYTAKLRRG